MTATGAWSMGAATARPVAARESIGAEVLQGLSALPKTLPPKLFYDTTGAALFERITALPEYYLTRAELEILRDRAREIALEMGPRCALVEYGSGAGVKVRLLLDALEHPVAYVPIDISSSQLSRVASSIAANYPGLDVRPLAADYTRPIATVALPGGDRRLAFFPGSTIGNFAPREAMAFLRRIRAVVEPDGALLLGVDRLKDERTLHAAYNDIAGVTAAFNLNILVRLNRELAANFVISDFAHRAFFNRVESRVEMHLVSMRRQSVTVDGVRIPFAKGESIWTESSYKYDSASLTTLVASAGYSLARLWSDEQARFWVGLLRPCGLLHAPEPESP